MNAISGLFSRLLNGSHAQLERRVADLPFTTERRQGPRCDNCGFGTLHVITPGMPNAGKLRCNRPGCGHMTDLAELEAVGANEAA